MSERTAARGYTGGLDAWKLVYADIRSQVSSYVSDNRYNEDGSVVSDADDDVEGFLEQYYGLFR